MIVESVTDLSRVYKVLKDPEIFERVAEPGIDIDEYEAPETGAFYVMDKDNIGLMIFHWQNNITLECHVHVLKQHRDKAYNFCTSSLEWAWHNLQPHKIVAQIPEYYPSVMAFAEKCGFEREGVNRASYLKDGKIWNQVYYGLKRA